MLLEKLDGITPNLLDNSTVPEIITEENNIHAGQFLYPIYTEQSYPDRNLDSDLDREILSRVNTRSGLRFR